jgi:hypothetical protein
MNNLSKILQQKTSELEKEMFDMRNQIEVIAEQMKLQIDSSKEELFSSLENPMCGHFNSVSSIHKHSLYNRYSKVDTVVVHENDIVWRTTYYPPLCIT